jgi:hypothetical protein
MEEIKKCPYCHECMVYGLRPQTMMTTIEKDGKHINKFVKYNLYAWSCSMKEDDCDVIFDKKDSYKNNMIMEDGKKKLEELLSLS